MKNKILKKEFFARGCLETAPDLVGKIIVRTLPGGEELRLRITETEAYCGEEDTACHASKGRTKRNEILYGEAGVIYVYLCYGIHWLMNIVTGETGTPEATLIRACEIYNGPGKLTKCLRVDKSFNYQKIYDNPLIRIEDDGLRPEIIAKPRIGIDYATPEYRDKPWRFIGVL